MPRKEKNEVTLVFENGAYRVVDVLERTRLIADQAIVFEKAVEDKGLMAHFYRRVN